METAKQPYFLGIDLNERYAMISFYQLNMKEPETVSMIAGSEIYQIPMVIGKKKNIGQWYIGDEARKLAKTSDVVCIDELWRRTRNHDKIEIEGEEYQAEDLFILYMKKLFLLPQKLGNPSYCDRLVVTMEHLDRECMDLLWNVSAKLNLKKEQFMVLDHKESFYYFALNQKPELFFHDVVLFEYETELMKSYRLERNIHTTPQLITILESDGKSMEGDRDLEFIDIMQDTFGKHMISSVYLVGDGFDGQWMKASLPVLCRGRRAFMGKNLFSKGACYAAAVCQMQESWPYIYMGENEMKFNLRVKVLHHGKMEFYDLITAGKNWFEIKGECEVILSGSHEINFWKQLPHSREAKIETLELTDFPERPDRTTRLRIVAKPVSDEEVEIEIKDMGFGEIFRATDKIWKYKMSM